jgi:hypothetical protein
MVTRCRSLRHELDRLDDALSMLTRDERADIEASAVTMRDLLDGLEAEIDKRRSSGEPASARPVGPRPPRNAAPQPT